MKLGKIKIDHVKISLFLVLVYLATVPHITALKPYAFMLTVSLFFILAALAFVFSAWVDGIFAVILAAGWLIARLKFNLVAPEIFVFRAAAISAFAIFHFTLLIGPWTRFLPKFLPFYKHRRHFGVTTFLLAVTHVSFIFNIYFQYKISFAFQAVFVFFGYTALMIMLWLALTSWDAVQKHNTSQWWWVLHAGLLVYYGGVVAYFMRTTTEPLLMWQKGMIIGFVVFWLLVAPWGLPRKILRHVNGWKQLHVLIYIAYVSLIAHVWTAIVYQQPQWLSVTFWILVGVVVASHAVGLVIKLAQEWRHRRSDKPRVPSRREASIRVGDAEYLYACAADSMKEGRATIVRLQGTPLAVYRDHGSFFAMATLCPHQNGPIGQGKIVNGFVECPWHKYQFGTKNGRGPAGFKDCVPYYPAVERDGQVYVSLQRVKNKDYKPS